MKQLFLLIAISLGCVNAASFDCKKASTKIEKTICGTPSGAEFLNGLDERLSSKYNIVKKGLPHAERKSFTQSQREWLKKRNESCETHFNISNCLKPMYKMRIELLNKKYKNILFAFPPKKELEKVCNDIALNTNNFILNHNIYRKTNTYDINNDGIDEVVNITSASRARVDTCRYALANGKTIEPMEIGYEWKDYWTYGIVSLKINNTIYQLHTQGSNYLSIITPANEEYVMCEFNKKTIETMVPNQNITDAEELCLIVESKNKSLIKYIEFNKETEFDIKKLADIPYNYLSGYETNIDYNNDGIKNRVLSVSLGNGIGRGCGKTILDEIDLKENKIKDSKSRELLSLEMKKPTCIMSAKLFKYKNKIYLEIIYNKTHDILLIKNNEIKSICTGKSRNVTTVKLIRQY